MLECYWVGCLICFFLLDNTIFPTDLHKVQLCEHGAIGINNHEPVWANYDEQIVISHLRPHHEGTGGCRCFHFGS